MIDNAQIGKSGSTRKSLFTPLASKSINVLLFLFLIFVTLQVETALIGGAHAQFQKISYFYEINRPSNFVLTSFGTRSMVNNCGWFTYKGNEVTSYLGQPWAAYLYSQQT